jgi:hypothetical protein
MNKEISIFGLGLAGKKKGKCSILLCISALKTVKFGLRQMLLIYAFKVCVKNF